MKIRIDKEKTKNGLKFVIRKFDGMSVIGEMWGTIASFDTEQQAIDYTHIIYPQLTVKKNY